MCIRDRDRGLGEPVAVGLLGGDLFLDLFVLDDAVLLEVDQEELAGLQAAEASFYDAFRADLSRAGLDIEELAE